jgi:hypothetical protein
LRTFELFEGQRAPPGVGGPMPRSRRQPGPGRLSASTTVDRWQGWYRCRRPGQRSEITPRSFLDHVSFGHGLTADLGQTAPCGPISSDRELREAGRSLIERHPAYQGSSCAGLLELLRGRSGTQRRTTARTRLGEREPRWSDRLLHKNAGLPCPGCVASAPGQRSGFLALHRRVEHSRPSGSSAIVHGSSVLRDSVYHYSSLPNDAPSLGSGG